ncbi:uncharacterized protein BDV17DRAFT_296120 [Aspergillus undulatus]|uniref:uncharacterized protein n=1 Tax=Aspergillus undulatus TaxID=1810928 RepID=UPI003CCD0E6D
MDNDLTDVYCQSCESPASESCWLEHIVDLEHRPSSPDLAEALFTSAFDLRSPEMVNWWTDENTGFEAQMDFIAESQLQGGLQGSLVPTENQQVQRSSTAPMGLGGQAANQCVAEPNAPGRTPLDYSPPDPKVPYSHYHSLARRSKSNPSLGQEAENRYTEEVIMLYEKVVHAIDVIEAEKNKMRLTRQRDKDWGFLLDSFRYIAQGLREEDIIAGRRVPKMALIREWVRNTENLALRLELDVKKLRFRNEGRDFRKGK